MPPEAGEGPVYRLLRRAVDIRPAELPALGWSILYVFAVLSAYYVIRPIRDEMGVQGGVNNLQWLFTGTLLAMLAVNPPFAALVRRLPRERFIAVAYRFFMANLLVFMVLLALSTETQNVWLGRAFFVWTSVFNLFVVSVFWALMVDVFDSGQGKRLFGLIAAGATVGAILGSSLTASMVQSVGSTVLLVASILLLELAVFSVRRLSRLAEGLRREPGASPAEAPIGGGVLAGLTHTLRSPYLLNIGVYILLYAITSTFLYFQQAQIAADAFTDRAARTAFFARIDLLVNVLTLVIQIFLTSRILGALGVALTLAALPLFNVIGFATLSMVPVVGALVAFQVARRVGNFALARPTREILFTVVTREDKYKAKNFIDTVVYRAGDQIGSWAYALLVFLGLGMTGISIVAVPLSVAWVMSSLWLGRRQEERARDDTVAPERTPALAGTGGAG
ncbi:MAG: MFS transporter [Alphaproteobacteria bacterium]|nr:MFS transporter [Alphaproteobacteria bacterium]